MRRSSACRGGLEKSWPRCAWLVLCLCLGVVRVAGAQGATNSSGAPDTNLAPLSAPTSPVLDKSEGLTATVPGMVWGLLILNLAVSGLGAALLVLRSQKAMAAQVNAVLERQMPELTRALVDRFQPKLEAFTQQGQVLIKHLAEAEERNREFLRSIEVVPGQLARQVSEWKEAEDGAIQNALRVWEGQSRAMLDRVKEQASAEFKEVFAQALEVWRSGLAQEAPAAQPDPASRKAEEVGQDLNRRDQTLAALAWPPCFQEVGPLAGWRQRIQERMDQGDTAAFDLFLALARFTKAVREQDEFRKLAETLHAISVEAYRFWKALGLPALDPALEWRSGFQSFLDSSGITLEIILALERDRFDLNSMLSADAGASNRMYVKEALSWIVRDKSSERPKVLHPARVITY